MAIALANVDKNGKAPDARIKDAAAAFKCYQQIEESNRIANANRAIVDDEIAGAPPNDPDDMAEAGLGSMSNFNSLQANADDEAASSSYVSLNDATPHLMTVQTGYGEIAQRFEWEEKISGHLDWLFKTRYKGFRQNEQLLAKWYTRDGFAVVQWPHDIDWRWKVRRLGQFIFPTDAPIDESQLDIALFVEDKTPPELFQMLRKSKLVTDKSDKSAVNQDEVIKAIKDCGNANSNKVPTYADLEKRFAGNEVGEAYGSTERLTIVHLYVKEFPSTKGVSGRVSHYIIRADGKCKEFLYHKRNAFPCMEEMMVFYADGVGTGTIGSLQGQIAKSFPIYIAKDLLLNKWHDRTNLNLNLYMEGDGTQGSVELLSQQAFGSITVLGGKVKFVELPGANDTGAQCTPLLAELNRIGSNNNGAYQSHAVSPEGGARTLGEVNLQAASSAQLQGAKQTNLYLSKAPHYWNVIQRLQNKAYTSADPGWAERMEFFKRLTDDGVPLEAFFQINEVTPMRAVGYGSYQARQSAFNTLNGLRGFMDETGKANLNRDMAAAGGAGYDNAGRYFPTAAEPRTALDQKIADLQNGCFVAGTPQPVYPDDNHPVHAVEHDKFMNGLIQQASQGAIAPDAALKALGAALDHQKAKDPQNGQGHLDFMEKAGDATQKPLLKILEKSFGNLTKQFATMQAHVQQQQPAPGQAPQPLDPKLAAANLTALATALKDGATITHDQFNAALVAMGLPPYPPGTGVALGPQGQPISTPVQLPPSGTDQAALIRAQAEVARAQSDVEVAKAQVATNALKAGAASHPGPMLTDQPAASPAALSPELAPPVAPAAVIQP